MKKRELTAIQKRYEGEPAEHIAQSVGVSVGTVNNWFTEGGRLHDEYLKHEKEENGFRTKEAQIALKRSINRAAQTLVDLLDSSNPSVRLRAAVEMIDRVLGKPVQPVEPLKDPAAEILEAFREGGREYAMRREKNE